MALAGHGYYSARALSLFGVTLGGSSRLRDDDFLDSSLSIGHRKKKTGDVSAL